MTSGCSWLGHFSHHQPSCVSSIRLYLHLGTVLNKDRVELLVTSWDIGLFSTKQGPSCQPLPTLQTLSLLHTCWQGLGSPARSVRALKTGGVCA